MNDVVGTFPRHDRFTSEGFIADMAIAAQKDGVRFADEPGAADMLSAAFRQSNSLGSVLSSQSLGELLSPTDGSPPIDPDAILTGLKADGLGHHANLFEDVTTRGQYDARLADLKRELADRQTLQASGGMLAELAMGVIDPVNLLPLGAGFTVARGVRGALKVGAGIGATSAAAQEAVLQQAQVTRTWEESLANVAASTVFGAGLGLGGHGLQRLVGAKVATRIMEGFDEASNDLRTGGAKLEQRIVETTKLHEEFLPGRAADAAIVSGVDVQALGARALDELQAARSRTETAPDAGPVRSDLSVVSERKTLAGREFNIDGGPRHVTYELRDGSDNISVRFIAILNADGRTMSVSRADVSQSLQRKGIATAVYDDLAARAQNDGLTLVPSSAVELSPEGRAFWETRLGRDLVARDAGRTGPFVADTSVGPRAHAAGAAPSSAPRDTNVYSSSDRIDARLAGVPIDKLLKNFGKSLRKVPYVGDAIAQGLRNPRLELQDSISPTARSIISRLDENPYILRAEAAGEVRSEGVVFSEVFRQIEGGHAAAIKEIDGIWRKSRKEFGNDRVAFGERVYFAAINNGVDEAGSVAVQKAANLYRHRVFNPIQKLFTDAGLLKEGVNVKGAESYTPWVHRADAIIDDKENFLSVHSAAFREQLEREYAAAVTAKTEHEIKTAQEVFVLEAERNVKIAEVKKTYNGDSDAFGKIKDAQLDKQRVVEDVKLERKTAIEKAKLDRDDELAQPTSDPAEDAQHTAALDHVAKEHATRVADVKEKYNGDSGKIQELQRDRDRMLDDVRLEREAAVSRVNDIRAQDLSGGKSPKAVERAHVSSLRKVEREFAVKRERVAHELDDKIEAARAERDDIIAQLDDAAAGDALQLNKRREASTGKAAGAVKQAANQKFDAEMRRIEREFSVKEERTTRDADRKIAEQVKARDDAIKSLNEETKGKIDTLRAPPSKLDRELLKLGDSDTRDVRSKKLAQDYYNGATSGADHLMLGDEVSDILLPSVLKARKSPILQKHAAEMGWAETNIFDLGDIYHRGAGAAAAMATVFKKSARVKNEKTGEFEDVLVADINLTEALKQVAQDFDAKIDAITGAKLPEGSLGKELPSDIEVKLRQAKSETLRNIEIMRDGLLGRRQTFGSKALQETADLAMQFNSWRLMGGSVLASLADPMNIVVANGFGKSWSNGLVPAFKNFKAYLGRVAVEDEPAILRMNRLSAAVVEREKNSFMAAMMDLHNPSTGRTQAQIFSRNVSKQFWNWTGLTAWTQFWKNVIAGVNHARIIDAAGRGFEKLSQSERAWLANLRIDGDVLARIATAYEGQSTKHSAGIPYGAFDEWTDKLAASRFADALSREGKNVIVTPTVGDKLAFQHTPFGLIVGQFRSYGIAATGKLVARNAALKGLDGEKTGAFYTGLFMIGLMGAVVDGMKFVAGDMTLDGSSKRDASRTSIDLLIEKWAKTPGEQAYNVLDRTGIVMPLTEPSNILQKLGLPNLQRAFSVVARDDKGLRAGSARFMHRSVAEAALGPSIGLLEDTANLARLGTAFGKYMVGVNENNLTSSDFSKGRRLFPFQNAPAVQQIINTGHQRLGTIFDWPTP